MSPHSSVRLGLISEGTNTWPLYVAQAQGLFERRGLRVEATVTGSSVKQQEMLIAGEFDIGFQQPDHVVRAVEQGSDLFAFAAHGHAPEVTVLAAAGITDIAQLRGRKIAVDGARTGYALLLRRLLRQRGFSEPDIVFVEFGGSQERFDAIKGGAAAAGMLNPPFDAGLVAAGFVSLARMSEAFPSYPGSVMAARRSWALEHRSALEAFVGAMDEAYAWLQARGNADAALQMLPERLKIAPKAAAAALEKLAARPRPKLTEDGMRQAIETVWESEGYQTPKGEPSKYMDLVG